VTGLEQSTSLSHIGIQSWDTTKFFEVDHTDITWSTMDKAPANQIRTGYEKYTHSTLNDLYAGLVNGTSLGITPPVGYTSQGIVLGSESGTLVANGSPADQKQNSFALLQEIVVDGRILPYDDVVNDRPLYTIV
jgi:hypothetical protein